MAYARPEWRQAKADRQRGKIRTETVWTEILHDAHPLKTPPFVDWNEMGDLWPEIGPETAPVTIYAPDGTFRERVSAHEFRRRYPPRLWTVRR